MLDQNHLKKINILVVGDVMLDTQYYGDAHKFAPDAPIPVVKISNVKNTLGGAANVANNLASLGIRTYLCGFCGKDKEYDTLKSLLRINGTINKIVLTENRTTNKITLIGRNIDGESQKITRIDFEERVDLKKYKDAIMHKLDKLIHRMDAIIISDYNKGCCEENICRSLIKKARENGIPVVVDPKKTNWSCYRYASYVKPNMVELENAYGKVIKSEIDIIRAARALCKKYSIRNVVVSRSESGLTYVSRNEYFTLPAKALNVTDVIGAGDTLVATFTACLSVGIDLKNALDIANNAASIVCGKVGASPIELVDLLDVKKINGPYKKLIGIKNIQNGLKVDGVEIKKRKIVFTNGYFDVVHSGHIRFLREAKKCGDLLVVGINSDCKKKTSNSVVSRPFNKLADRISILESIADIDYIIEFDDRNLLNILKRLSPDVLVKGGNYKIGEVKGSQYAKKTKIIPIDTQSYEAVSLSDEL